MEWLRGLFGRRRVRAPYPRLGPLLRLDDLTGECFERHSVWVNDLSGEEESGAGFDETSVRPVLSEASIDPVLARKFFMVSIAVRRHPDGRLGVAEYTAEGTLADLSFPAGTEWVAPTVTVEVRAVPTIEGRARVCFSYDPSVGVGTEIAE